MPTYSFVLNGDPVSVDAPGDVGLLYIMRDLLGVTGPKYGCGVGVCHACTCHLDGEAFQPCITRVSEVEGREVTSIEGLADGDTLHPLQQAWIELDVPACGYCQPGQIMNAATMIRGNRVPSDAEIDAIQNICRCGTYFRIREAIKQAARAPAGRTASTTQEVAGATTAAGSAPAPTDAEGVLGSAAGLLEAAGTGSTRQAPLPATGSGLGAAALVAAAAAAVRRGRDAGEDEAAGA